MRKALCICRLVCLSYIINCRKVQEFDCGIENMYERNKHFRFINISENVNALGGLRSHISISECPNKAGDFDCTCRSFVWGYEANFC